MREQWPALSHLFGLKPWDADPDNPGCLTWGELLSYQQALQEHAEAARAAEARMTERG